MTTKGERRKGVARGNRLAFDDTKDRKRPATKTTKARKTTTKGEARKTAPVGSRLAYDNTKQDRLSKWRNAVKKANAKLGTTGVAPRKGSKAYTLAKSLM